MQEMLTRWGFTTVWDLGSDPADSLPLRRRIASGEVLGPNIFLAGSIFPSNGRPAYLPAEMQLPEAATPEASAKMGRGYLDIGLDGLKLFTGVYKGEDSPVVNMDIAIAKAAEYRRRGNGDRIRRRRDGAYGRATARIYP
jgi:hypothetical protein